MNTITTTHVNENGLLVFSGAEFESFDGAEVALAEAGDDEMEQESGFGVLSIKAARKKKEEEEDEEDDAPADDSEEDDWDGAEEGEEEEEEWDPDFDEFDIPKSTKKGAGGKDEEEEDVKFDEDLNEFDDLFGDGGDDFDDDDDF
jgi:DNA-directed RNA polymerase subunit delta